MVKFILAAVWICLATIGSMYFAFSRSAAGVEASAAPAAPSLLGGLDVVRTEVMSVPVLGSEGINGYFLTRLVYSIDKEKAKKLVVPADTLITDGVYGYLFSNPAIDFTKTATLDVDAMRNGVKEELNRRIGEPIVQDVMIEQIDFLTKDEIRDNAMRRRKAAVAKANATAPKAEEAKASGGH